jgi:emfourin
MRTRTELTSEALPADAAATLVQKVGDAALSATADPSAESGFADALQYDVEVERDGRLTRGTFTDASIPDSVRRLVEWVDSRPEKSLGPAH